MRSPHVKNNIYNAVVKVTGQLFSLTCQASTTNKYGMAGSRPLLRPNPNYPLSLW